MLIQKHVPKTLQPNESFIVAGTPLSVGHDPVGNLCVWFIEDHKRAVVLPMWTGWHLDAEVFGAFLGTVASDRVWHFFWWPATPEPF